MYFKFLHRSILSNLIYCCRLTESLFICSKLFELLSLAVALAELTWPTILSRRNLFRYGRYASLLMRVSFHLEASTYVYSRRLYSSCLSGCREVFLDFDPISVSKLNEKKICAPESLGSTLLSEIKLRNIVENARQVCKVYTILPFMHSI